MNLTLRLEAIAFPPGFGVRRSSAACERPSLSKAPEDWRTPRRWRAVHEPNSCPLWRSHVHERQHRAIPAKFKPGGPTPTRTGLATDLRRFVRTILLPPIFLPNSLRRRWNFRLSPCFPHPSRKNQRQKDAWQKDCGGSSDIFDCSALPRADRSRTWPWLEFTSVLPMNRESGRGCRLVA